MSKRGYQILIICILVFWCLCLIPVHNLQEEYTRLHDRSRIQAETIERYSTKIDELEKKLEQQPK